MPASALIVVIRDRGRETDNGLICKHSQAGRQVPLSASRSPSRAFSVDRRMLNGADGFPCRGAFTRIHCNKDVV